jgi:hypothetical protein
MFPLGLWEAKRLKLKVTEAPAELYEAMWSLLDYYRGLDRSLKPVGRATVPVGAPAPKGSLLAKPLGHIDSTGIRFDCVGLAEFVEGKPQSRGANWLRLE